MKPRRIPANSSNSEPANRLAALRERITSCRACPRLTNYRESVARKKRRSFHDWEYWGRPVAGFGDPHARLLILGLAPAAHGANRTGRVFTGDRSGDFLYAALYRAGFANQPASIHREDGLMLHDAWVTAVCRCAPPANRPLPKELLTCRPYLEEELEIMHPRVVLALGAIAMRSYLEILKARGTIRAYAQYPFSHGACFRFPPPLPILFASYHPSQQNTFTGKLTPAMFLALLRRIRGALEE
jgi:uracil-DNA glycosylase family 4